MSDEAMTVGALRGLVRDFVAEREWECYHDAKNLSMSIAIEAAELMEHFQWLRSDELVDVLENDTRRAEIVDEVADVACYVLALVNVLGIDLSSALKAKLIKNAAKYPTERFRGRYFRPGE